MLPFEREGRQSGNCVRDTPFVSPNDGQCPDIRAPTRLQDVDHPGESNPFMHLR